MPQVRRNPFACYSTSDNWLTNPEKACSPHAFRLPTANNRPIISRMTVCIGALCEHGKAIVLAADRQVTSAAHLMRAEGPDCKIRAIPDDMLIAAAGQPFSGSWLKRKAAPLEQSVADFASRVSTDASAAWRDQVSRQLVGMSFQEFLTAAGAGELVKSIVEDVWKAISNRSPDLVESYLVAGVRGSKAELHVASSEAPGRQDLECPGFGAIGAGESLATAYLYQHARIKTYSLAEAVYRVFAAKKAAQSSALVGEQTDMAVAVAVAIASVDRGVFFLTEQAIAALQQIHAERRIPLSNTHAERINGILPSASQG
jgi:hypothetical protein